MIRSEEEEEAAERKKDLIPILYQIDIKLLHT